MFLPDKVIIADHHPLFRQALLATLKQRMTTTVGLQAETVEELDQLLIKETDADLLLLDLNIPGAHGFNTLIHVRQHFPEIPVVVVSAYEDIDTINKAMSYGASGFVPKSTDVNTIFTAINQVLSGELWTPEAFNTIDASDSKAEMAERIASLTKQQYKILLMLAEGLLNKQIAYDLRVSAATIKVHVTAIFRKLKVNNRTQAVISLGQLDLKEDDFSQKLSQ